jgi:Tfp pilus assembly protein PilO
MQTGLEGKPFYWGLLVAIGVSGVLFWVANTAKFTEMNAEIARQEQTLTSLQAQLTKGRIAKQQLPQFREEVRRLEGELDKLLLILPARRNTPELLRRIRALTEQGDFAIIRIQPAANVDRDFYSEWPIKIQLEGTYHNLALFFDRISRFSRIINVDDLQVGTITRPTSSHTISASFTAKTFIYKDTPPEEDLTGGAGGR